MDLTRINPAATHLVFTVTSFQGHTFDEVDNAFRNVSTTLRQWHLDFKLDFLRLALVG